MEQDINMDKNTLPEIILPKNRTHSLSFPYMNKENRKKKIVKDKINASQEEARVEFEKISYEKNKILKELRSLSNRYRSGAPKTKTKFGEYQILEKHNANTNSHYYYRDKKKYLILDEEKLRRRDFLEIGELIFNNQENMVAYCVDYKGDERYEVFIKDFISVTKPEIKLRGEYLNAFEFSYDDKFLYLVRIDKNNKPYEVISYNLETRRYKSVYQESRDGYHLSIANSRDNRHLIISSQNNEESDIWILSYETDEIIKFDPPSDVKFYQIDIYKGKVYLLTTEKESKFYVKGIRNWELLKKFDESVLVNYFTVFEEFLVLEGRKDGFNNIGVYIPKYKSFSWLEKSKMKNLQLYDQGYPDDISFIIQKNSWISPTEYIKYELNYKGDSLILSKIGEDKIKNYDKTAYSEKYLTFKNSDGDLIPISYVKKKNVKTKYTWVEFYGAYGEPLDPEFDDFRTSLLDRGISLAFIHARGGGEFGKRWHEGGSLLNKRNTFNDIVEGIDFLIDKKITDKKKIIISGGSAGGMAAGVVTNMIPDKILLTILRVPFLDVLTTMLQPDLPLTMIEYQEWGNPSLNEKNFDYIKSYSPIENIKAKNYPDILISAGLNDYRVGYWEPYRYYHKINQFNKNKNTKCILKYNELGHDISLDPDIHTEETAEQYAYALYIINKE